MVGVVEAMYRCMMCSPVVPTIRKPYPIAVLEVEKYSYVGCDTRHCLCKKLITIKQILNRVTSGKVMSANNMNKSVRRREGMSNSRRKFPSVAYIVVSPTAAFIIFWFIRISVYGLNEPPTQSLKPSAGSATRYKKPTLLFIVMPFAPASESALLPAAKHPPTVLSSVTRQRFHSTVSPKSTPKAKPM